MKDLYFMNPVFRSKTLNLTVRRGNKWNDYQGPVIIKDTDTKKQVSSGKIIYTEAMSFDEISDHDLVLEHDPECRTKIGLLKELKRVYGVFEQQDEVTLVYFKVG